MVAKAGNQTGASSLIRGAQRRVTLGQNYVMLWKAEELKPLNAGYEVARFAPGLFLFGSDGGGEAYAFDIREDPWVVIQVPFIGMGDPQYAIPLGRSFTEFLKNVAR